MKETLEEFIIREGYPIGSQQEIWEDGVRNGAKWQQEQDKNKYSEEDMFDCWKASHTGGLSDESLRIHFKHWFERFKKKSV